MKKVHIMIMLACLCLGIGSAYALPITFDEISPQFLDTTGSVFVEGIHFSADTEPGGSTTGPGSDLGVLFGDLSLVNGDPVLGGDSYATITLDFVKPVKSIRFDFLLNATANLTEGAAVVLLNNGTVVGNKLAPAIFDANLSLSVGTLDYYLGLDANQAVLYFDPSAVSAATYFQLDNLTNSTVPEPGTMVLVSIGLAGFGLIARMKNKG